MQFSFVLRRDHLQHAVATTALADSEKIRIRFSAGGLDVVRERPGLICITHCPVEWRSSPLLDVYTLETDRSYFDHLLLKLVGLTEIEITGSLAEDPAATLTAHMHWTLKAGAPEPTRNPHLPVDDDPNLEDLEPVELSQTPTEWTIELTWPFVIVSKGEAVPPPVIDSEVCIQFNPAPIADALRSISRAAAGSKNLIPCRIEAGRTYGGRMDCIRLVEDPRIAVPPLTLDPVHTADVAHVLARLRIDTARVWLEEKTIIFLDEMTVLRLEIPSMQFRDWPDFQNPLIRATMNSSDLSAAIARICSQGEGKTPIIDWSFQGSTEIGTEFRTFVRAGIARLTHKAEEDSIEFLADSPHESTFSVDASLLQRLVPMAQIDQTMLSFYKEGPIGSTQVSDQVAIHTFVNAKRSVKAKSNAATLSGAPTEQEL